jgi:hypothetical protein
VISVPRQQRSRSKTRLSQQLTAEVLNLEPCTSTRTARSHSDRMEMSWFYRSGGKPPPKAGSHAPGRLPTVQTPPGYPGLTPPSAPKKRGKTAQQYGTELAAYRRAMREHFAAIAAFNRKRTMALGIESYEWIATDVHRTCDTARRNGGRSFSYANPPPEDHVCEGQCNSIDWCRCIARPIVAGFK